jgi:hypothetical protein
MPRTNGYTEIVIEERLAINPYNVTETYRINVHYAAVITYGNRYTSSGDVGDPDEAETYFADWEAYDEEIPVPEWCTDDVVRAQFTP